jgi:hypothetical protein
MKTAKRKPDLDRGGISGPNVRNVLLLPGSVKQITKNIQKAGNSPEENSHRTEERLHRISNEWRYRHVEEPPPLL